MVEDVFVGLEEALSDECGTACSAVAANANEPQIQSCAAEPVPLFQLVAGGNPPRRDDVRQISAVAEERGGSAGRTWDRHLTLPARSVSLDAVTMLPG